MMRDERNSFALPRMYACSRLDARSMVAIMQSNRSVDVCALKQISRDDPSRETWTTWTTASHIVCDVPDILMMALKVSHVFVFF